MSKQSSPIMLPPRIVLVLLSTIFLCISGNMVIGIIQKGSNIPKMGERIDIRANRVAIIRIPTTPIQEINITEDGEVSLFRYPITPSMDVAKIALNATEQKDFKQFREQWCRKAMTVQPQNIVEQNYDIAVRCVVYATKQASLSSEELPPFINHILKRLGTSAPPNKPMQQTPSARAGACFQCSSGLRRR